MKFDKFMEHCYKILCLVTSMVVFVGALVSCASRPVSASAVDISSSEQVGIQDFLDAYGSNLNSIDFELNTDSDGNRNVRLSVLSSQTLFYNELLRAYDNMDFSIAPDTLNFSGTSSSGLYKSALDNQIHAVTLCPPPVVGEYGTAFTWNFAYSDEFNATIALNSSDNPVRVVATHFNDGSYFPNHYNGYTNIVIARFHGNLVLQSDSYFTGFTHSEYRYGNDDVGFSIDREGIPTLSRNLNFSLGNISNLGGSGVTSSLPSVTVDTTTPWDYYNDYLLPDIINNYDIDNIEEYLVFPDGYTPDILPTEPDYQNPNYTKIVPIIIGVPLPIDIVDDATGLVADILDVLADFLPDGGLQIQIDGVTITFPRDGDNVVINGRQYPLPLPDFQIDGHTINLPDNLHFDFDGVPFVINPDGTIIINGDTYNLPIGTPTQLSTDYDNYVYEYEIPTMENINIVDSTLSPVDLSSFADGVSGFYGLAARLYYDLGLFNPLIICLSVAAVGYAVSKIGGGH